MHGAGVTHAEVLEVFGRNVERLRSLLLDVIPALPVERTGGLLTDKPTGTLSGTLTCANTAALV